MSSEANEEFLTPMILEFIHRRFPDDCHWTDGNCYWFAKILCERFKFLKLGYEPVDGHFVAYTNDGFCYDWNGRHKIESEIYDWEYMEQFDKVFYDRVVRDCVE